MKSISIVQPWATFIAMGVKTILTYPFPTRYIGPLSIHAEDKVITIEDPYLVSVLASGGYTAEALPRDVEVARCKLIACEKIKPENIPCYPDYAFSDF